MYAAHLTKVIILCLCFFTSSCAGSYAGSKDEREKPLTTQQIPAWAPFFDSEKWGYFLKIVHGYFKTKEIEILFDENLGVIQNKQGIRMGLKNLAQLCSQNNLSEWPNLVANHFDAALKSIMETDEILKRIERYDQVENILAVRIWSDKSLEVFGEDKTVYRRDVEGTITVLVYDLPTGIVNVPPQKSEKWGKLQTELFNKAIANIRANFKPQITQETLAEGLQVWVFSGDNSYVASHILLMEHYPNCSGQYGSLVAIPHRHVILCYPISSVEVVKAINQLIPLIRKMEAQGPGSITSNLYWFHKGVFENLPYKLVDKVWEFHPPDNFVEMLNILSTNERESR